MPETIDEQITIEKTKDPKEIPADDDLDFGRLFSDHMFMMEYESGKGWHDPQIIPYQPLEIDPGSSFCHYCQVTFEGMKAYRNEDDEIMLFRPDKNAERLNNSNRRMCMPELDPEFFIKAVKTLVDVDSDWVPSSEGTSLYIRPFIVATEKYLGLKSSDSYKFLIIASPVGSYYPEGLKPTEIKVETEYVRSVKGGTGAAKTGGNYGRSLLAQNQAAEEGFDGVLWLDGRERKYVEEVGAMNVFFRIDDTIVTPSLEGTILPGITRDSVIKILEDRGEEVEERKLEIEELAQAYRNGYLQEAFGTGTAAVIAPIGRIQWEDLNMEINDREVGPLTSEIYDILTGIQRGRIKDKYDWTDKVK
ncbi:branched chain amino acid aminotransferase apoenzyme [Halarsenatibacter silvermanii]|uniref:Branched-chain-amino-acid aminotransferase n=1 Tax=Halarsenatibacter silvermanii TaxID=321763 RepID=A0A1G9QUN7_9FIRM|nr:branched-chain amino acid aminotransferase [Halarsenatibacter silvermanii]SDM14317.1 branched chain amino acid aminotransferase apoenzyme [Halarsenatibacter silvermanii]